MSETKITLEEAIKYMKEASAHEKNEQFRKFVEGAIIILKHFEETDANLGLELLIGILLDITDDYLETKDKQILEEAMYFLNLE